jgi:hypothetical protein
VKHRTDRERKITSDHHHDWATLSGVQIVARTYDDVTAFRVGAALEAELGWWANPGWRPA